MKKKNYYKYKRLDKYYIKKCKTCSQSEVLCVNTDDKPCPDIIRYCKLHKKLVDIDDKCRKWQLREVKRNISPPRFDSGEDNTDSILKYLKEIYDH